ncbi:MAG: UvrD-helicase domain-containing protein, partial [Lachnospiraceae bacterium]|nr:UvrD-helicase domain-containing protein [Lachnospiraceae bacterium]
LDILWEKTEGGLIPSKAAKELKHHFVSVMTDEYQDSNQVQELLLQSISSEDEGRYNRFMVGDVKQSIYKFRLARPEIFMEKYENYPLTACDNENRLRIDLNQNFRSRLNVLDAVNYLFAKIMQKSLGGIEYDRQAALYHGAEYPDNGDENQTELLLLNLSEENEEEDAVAEDFITDSNKELEAAMIARRIKEMVGKFKVTDKESKLLRPICYRDIVILLRTTKEWDEVFKKVLGKEGIPAITSARTGYFAAAEIQTILHVVGILNNPHQDIPLFGVMKSFFGGFADEEIAIIKARGDKREGLYDKLLNFVCTDEIDEKLSEKISKFKNFIEINRRKAIYTPIFALLNELIMGSGYYYDALVRPDGERRAANLEMLLKKASSFAGTGYHGLFHFVRYIEQLEKYDVDYGEANVLDEQADIVRLMSIHKSKGLEFPVCFVAGLSKPINMMNARGTLCLDIDLGLGVDYIDNKLRVKKKTLKKSVVSQKIKLDSLGEELRILYVAMTRAKEKLILTGTTKKLPPVGCDSQSRPSFLKLISTRSFLDLIISPAMSTEADGIIATRIFSKKDLASATINEIVDLSRRRELLLTALEYDRHCGHDPQSADLAISKSNYIKEKVTEMSEKFKRPYPHANLASLYAKTTVSELKKADTIAGVINIDQNSVADIYNQDLFELPEVVPYIPQFMKEEMPNKNISGGSERGSAYHKVMEFIKFKELNHRAELYAASFSADNLELNITRQLEAALQNSRISPEYKDAVPMDKILAFFITKKNNALSLSSLSARMIAADQADQLYKEQPFVIGLPADRLNPDLPNEETILIQGIIDAFFIEADGIVVLDYKSDAVKTADELISRYQKQLDYYGEALEQLTGKSVKEKIIYSFALEEAVYL